MLESNTGDKRVRLRTEMGTEGDRLICFIAAIVANTGGSPSEGDRLIREMPVHP